MPQRRHLPNDARLRALGILEGCMRQVEVARRLGVSQSVISRLRTRLAQTNSNLDRRRSGRPRSTSQAQDRFLRTSALRSRSVSAEQLRERLSRTGTRVSVQTVRNRLHSVGLRARRPYVGVPLSQRQRQARQAWIRQHRRWTNQQWATVLFTDESRFLLDMLDRRRRVWRRRGERYANCAIVEHDRYGGGSLMVWGGISVRSRTELLVLNGTLTGQRYTNEVLQPVVLPFVQQHHVVLQDDNARPHRARIVQQFLQQNNVDNLDWPARPWLVASRACLGHSRPACTTESSTTKNAPSFGRSLAEGVEEDTPATDCQTHKEYASSLCGLHRCNRWTYAILTDLWGFIGDPSDLPYKFSHSHLVLQTPTDGFLSVNEMM